MQETSLSLEKKQIRELLKARRAAIKQDDHITYSQRICDQVLAHPKIKEAKTVFGFISWSSEINTHPLMKALLRENKTLLVPKILSREIMQAQILTDWTDLREDRLGILAPQTSFLHSESVDVVITPGLGFTDSGHRIGFGAGYYDRWFSQHEHSYRLAIAFEAQVIESLPVETTDIPVHEIITERRSILIEQ